jgi:hypothetical protein
MYRFEDLIRGSLRGGLIFGYAPATVGHRTPMGYKTALLAELTKLEKTALVSATCVSSSLEELDQARRAIGITVCCLVPDRILVHDLERILRCVKGDERDFFTPRFRSDPAARKKKPKSLLERQRGTLFELFPEVHQDFVLVIAHEPRIETYLRAASHACSPLFDYRHHHRMIALD